MKLVLGWKHKNLGCGLHLPEGLILVSRTASVVGDMRSPTISTFWTFLCLDSFCGNELHHTQHISVFWYNLVSCSQNPGN